MDTEEVVAEVEDVEEVEEETTQETEESKQLDRDLMLENIADKIKASREQNETIAEELEEEVVELEKELDDAVEEMVTLKVDGEAIQKTAEEVEAAGGVIAYQMTLAADKRFKEAAAEKASLAILRSELQQKEQELNERPTEVEETGSVELSEEVLNEFIANIYSGDEDKAKESFKSVLSGIKAPIAQPASQIDEQKIIDMTLYKIDQEKGIDEFQKDYKHLSTDPNLRKMVNEATIKIRTATPNKKPSEIIIEAAKEVDLWVNSFNPDMDLVKEQVDLKKKLNPVKTAKSRMKQDTGYKPKTQAEIFADQKASRSR